MGADRGRWRATTIDDDTSIASGKWRAAAEEKPSSANPSFGGKAGRRQIRKHFGSKRYENLSDPKIRGGKTPLQPQPYSEENWTKKV